MENVFLITLAIVIVSISIIILSGYFLLFVYFGISGAAIYNDTVPSLDQEVNYSENILLVEAYLDSLIERSNRVNDEYLSGEKTLDQAIVEYEDIVMRTDTLLQVFRQLKPSENYLEFHQMYLSGLEYYNKSKYTYLNYLKERENEEYEKYNELYINFSRVHSMSIDMFSMS